MDLAITKGDGIYEAYNDIYQYHKDFGIPESSDDYWAEAVQRGSAISQKYRETIMSRVVDDHIHALMETWHEMLKGGKKNEQ